jgi:hypothetical protein
VFLANTEARKLGGWEAIKLIAHGKKARTLGSYKAWKLVG